MKRILAGIIVIALTGMSGSLLAQPKFQATFNYSGNTISFKLKPNGDISTGFSVIEFFVTVPAAAPAFTWGTLTENSSNFPGIGSFVREPEVTAGGVRYTHFYYTAPEPVTTVTAYTGGQEYEVFTIDINVNPATLNMDMVHSPGDEDPYYLAITDQFGGDLRALPETNFFYPLANVNTSGDPYFVSLSQIVTPAILGDFAVTRKGSNTALLSWSTLQEHNVSHFAIEKNLTSSGSGWTKIGEVKARGNSGTSSRYSFEDESVFAAPNASGTVFYRIRSVDLDKKETLFPTRSLRFTQANDKTITLYPNPAREGFTLSVPLAATPNNAPVMLHLVNRLGQVLQTRQINAALAANYYFDLKNSGVSSGEYMLQIVVDNTLLNTQKIIVLR